MISVFLLILFLLRNLFHPAGTLSSGDWPYVFSQNAKEFSWTLMPEFLWLAPYYQLPIKFFVGTLGIPWEIVERGFWIFGFLITGFFSSWYLAKTFFSSKLSQSIAILVYLTNTYILLLVGGGQFGVVLSYVFAPVIFTKTIELFRKLDFLRQRANRENDKKEKTLSKFLLFQSLILGFVYGLEIMFDPRIAYISAIAIGFYFVLVNRNYIVEKIAFLFFSLAIIVSFLLNVFWVLPFLFGKLPDIEGAGLSHVTLSGLRFFSFGTFEQSFSLLHPNWPENLFGKTSFMQPEFLILPLLAFSSLLFIRSKPQTKDKKLSSNLAVGQLNNLTIVYFVLLGLLGAFLGKGTNDPFGAIYEFLYFHVPGFVAFRDPTKFYILTALSFSVLIPFSLEKISGVLRIKYYIVGGIFIFFWLFTIRQAVFGKLSGTFQTHKVPSEYIILEKMFIEDTVYGKTLWIPQVQRFGYVSENHPAISANSLFKPNLPETFHSEKTHALLVKNSIAYVIVPYDSEGEIFQNDRRYDEELYKKTLREVSSLPWLEKIPGFSRIGVFRVKQSNLLTASSYAKLADILRKQKNQRLENIGTGVSLVTTLIAVCFFLLPGKRKKLFYD